MPMPPSRVPRGRPPVYSDRLFLKALIVMILRHLHRVHELLTALGQPTREMQTLKALFTENGRYPSRRTWERRLHALPDTLPSQIGCLGRYLVFLIQPWKECGRAIAIDSTLLPAKGGVWHKKHKDEGIVPHTSIDTEAGWTCSGWHGWVYGWKLHLASVVSSVWIPVAATLTPANTADNEEAPKLLVELPAEARFVLGDTHYNAPNVRELCERRGRILVATKRGTHPHTDDGVEVRRIFHKLRSLAIENLNEQFKAAFDAHDHVPTKGRVNTARFALGAVFVYQLALLDRFQRGLPLNKGLKPALKAA
jgi:hypothetical protein